MGHTRAPRNARWSPPTVEWHASWGPRAALDCPFVVLDEGAWSLTTGSLGVSDRRPHHRSCMQGTTATASYRRDPGPRRGSGRRARCGTGAGCLLRQLKQTASDATHAATGHVRASRLGPSRRISRAAFSSLPRLRPHAGQSCHRWLSVFGTCSPHALQRWVVTAGFTRTTRRPALPAL
jgi:hypothetical protein